MNEILNQFLLESRDFLQAIAASLLALERTPGDAGLMDELFRAVHTLKGNCGLFDFPDMFRVIHAAEDLMSEVREGRLHYSRVLADTLLDAMDFVSLQLDDIERDGVPPAGQSTTSVALAAQLRALAAGAGQAAPAAATEDGAPGAEAGMPAAFSALSAEQGAQWAGMRWIDYSPEPECFFKGEDPLHQAMQTPGLLWRQLGPAAGWGALDTLDPYHCRLRFLMVSSASREELEQHFRYVPEQVCIGDLPGAANPPANCTCADWNADALAIVQGQREALLVGEDAPWVAGRMLGAVATIRACMQACGRRAGQEQLLDAEAQALRGQSAAPLLAWLDQHAADTAAAAPAHTAPAAPPALVPDVAAVAAPETRSGRRADDQTPGRVLKVEQAKVDRLMNLIGEMVVARNGLPYLAARAENQYGLRELAREIKAQHAVINRIVEEMQDAIMQVRMTPVSFVFQRFPRLVRDIARRLGKEVELVLEGESTEADKNVIEALADPLVHIVRNALDHGIEAPSVRLAAGKPASGRLVIGARHEADRVLIEVADDGKGIDPAAIRRKAYEKGLIDEAQLERMDEREALDLVFLPGFSTAEQVSDLSGRGVGMDAVRSAVEKLGGTVRLLSEAGKGARLQLALPLSMAVSNVMIVESAGALYGVPMELVVETVRIPQASMHGIGRQRAAVLRERVVPLRPLNDLLLLGREQRANAEGELATLVLRVQGQYVGLVIDDFREVVEVILKPLAGILGGLGAYSGSALMGDGSVLMVINPKELLQ